MKTVGLGLLAVVMGLVLVVGSAACEDDDDEKETKMKFEDLPKAVQDAVKAKYPDAEIEEVMKSEWEITEYEIIPWEQFDRLLEAIPLPRPRIIHQV